MLVHLVIVLLIYFFIDNFGSFGPPYSNTSKNIRLFIFWINNSNLMYLMSSSKCSGAKNTLFAFEMLWI